MKLTQLIKKLELNNVKILKEEINKVTKYYRVYFIFKDNLPIQIGDRFYANQDPEIHERYIKLIEKVTNLKLSNTE